MAAADGLVQPLQLSDIIHTTSPSPSPFYNDDVLNRSDTAEQEPLTEADVMSMRRRLAEMGFTDNVGFDASGREKELVDMVLRLTESTLFDPTQLIQQAAIISGLTAQRDYLVRQVEEERERWSSQRVGFARIAEALIAQHDKPLKSIGKDAEFEPHCSSSETDNRVLREKLYDTQLRLQSLESELSKLKPILLMQPFASLTSLSSINHASSILSSLPYPSLHSTSKPKPKRKRKQFESRILSTKYRTPQDDFEINDGQTEAKAQVKEGVELPSAAIPPSSFFQFQAAPAPSPNAHKFSGDHYRKPPAAPEGGPLTAPPATLQFQLNTPNLVSSTHQLPHVRTIQPPSTPKSPAPSVPPYTAPSTPTIPHTPRSGRLRSHGRGTTYVPLTSDAHSEHLLLAARKIGRERAGVMAGFIRDQQSELEELKEERRKREITEREKTFSSTIIEGSSAGGMTSHYRDVGEGVNPQTPKRASVSGGDAAPTGGSRYLTGTGEAVTSPPIHHPLHQGDNPPFDETEMSPVRGIGREYVPGPGTGGAPLSLPLPSSSSYQPPPRTPSRQQLSASGSHGHQHGQPGQGQTNPTTPLASLLDAARMMDDNQNHNQEMVPAQRHTQHMVSGRGRGGGNKTVNSVNGKGNGMGAGIGTRNGTATGSAGRARVVEAVEQAESPPPLKRRRVSTARALAAMGLDGEKGSGKLQSGVGGRVRSALEVLADQAAAAVSSSDMKGKGKGREVVEHGGVEEAGMKGEDAVVVVQKGKGRVGKGKSKTQAHRQVIEKEREKPKEEEKSKSRSRTKAPRPSPRTRNLSAVLPPSPGDADANVFKSTGKSKLGPAPPRMISLPRPRKIGVTGSAPNSHGTSPLDMLPLPKSVDMDKKVAAGHSFPSSQTLLDGENNVKFGFTPVTRWTAVEEVSEEGSSPAIHQPEMEPMEGGNQRVSMEVEIERRLSPGVPLVIHEGSSDQLVDDGIVDVTEEREMQRPVENDVDATVLTPMDFVETSQPIPGDQGDPETEEADRDVEMTAADDGFSTVKLTGSQENANVHFPPIDQEVDVRQVELSPGIVRLDTALLPAAQWTHEHSLELLLDTPVIETSKAPDQDIAGISGAGAEGDVQDTEGEQERESLLHNVKPVIPELIIEVRPSPPLLELLLPLRASPSVANETQGPEISHGDSDADVDVTSEADAEGDVDAEGEVDSEVESPTVISPSSPSLTKDNITVSPVSDSSTGIAGAASQTMTQYLGAADGSDGLSYLIPGNQEAALQESKSLLSNPLRADIKREGDVPRAAGGHSDLNQSTLRSVDLGE